MLVCAISEKLCFWNDRLINQAENLFNGGLSARFFDG